MPATASCLVITTSAAAFSLSVVPLLPATGLPTSPRTTPAVRPAHRDVEELSPTGQRAASTAARATSGRTALRHRGLATSSLLPSWSVISCTGLGSQYLPSAARVAYAL